MRGSSTPGPNTLTADRRQILVGAAAVATSLAAPARSQNLGPRIVVIGGGFGGANCARTINKLNPGALVTLIEPNSIFTAPPLANAVLAGLRPIGAQQFDYSRIGEEGVTLINQYAVAVDAASRTVTVRDGSKLGYDRLVIAPGIDLRFETLPGYTPENCETMPHCWTDGAQAVALRRQIAAMDDGGVVVISAPVNPARCPSAPYERAAMIACYLKAQKPRSKVIILDSKDSFTLQHQFQAAWTELYPGLIEWVGRSQGGNVTSIDVLTKTFFTDFDQIRADVGNVIPPQKAGAIAHAAGVTDHTGWCPVDPATFASLLKPDIHVIGDAAIAGAVPKSAFAANEEGKICAHAIVASLAGKKPAAPKLTTTCYSLLAPDYAISSSGTYRPKDGQYAEIEGTGTSSPLVAPRSLRLQEANFAEAWYKNITREIFG